MTGRRVVVGLAFAALLSACELRILVKRSASLARVKHPTAAQRREAAAINAQFERDQRARDGVVVPWAR